MAFGKADAVSRLARCDYDLADAELNRRLDDIIGAHRVDAESFVIGLDQDARDGREMHDGVEGLYAPARVEIGKIAMHRKRVEDLTAIGDVGDEIGDARAIQRHEIEVVNLVAGIDEPRHRMATCLARTAGE